MNEQLRNEQVKACADYLSGGTFNILDQKMSPEIGALGLLPLWSGQVPQFDPPSNGVAKTGAVGPLPIIRTGKAKWFCVVGSDGKVKLDGEISESGMFTLDKVDLIERGQLTITSLTVEAPE